jgi:hypothetical protein
MLLFSISYFLKVGETIEYRAKYGFVNVGKMFLKVELIEKIRDIDCYKIHLFAEGGALGIGLYEDFISWVDTTTFKTVRFYKKQIEPGWNYEAVIDYYDDYVIYNENKEGRTSTKTYKIPPGAMDPVSLIFFVRFIELKDTVSVPYHMDGFSGYAKIFIKRKEKCEWLSIKENCFAISPILPMDEGKKREVLGDRGGEILISESQRIPVKIKVNLVVGSMMGHIVRRLF